MKYLFLSLSLTCIMVGIAGRFMQPVTTVHQGGWTDTFYPAELWKAATLFAITFGIPFVIAVTSDRWDRKENQEKEIDRIGSHLND